jgi:hypothetical protein
MWLVECVIKVVDFLGRSEIVESHKCTSDKGQVYFKRYEIAID